MKKILALIIALLAISSISFGQQKLSWDNWNWLMGTWIGEGGGQPGQGGGTFSFSLDLNNKILVRKSHSKYPAVENKAAVVHDDLMIVYPDFNGRATNAIYFDNEGHTINYKITYSDNSIVLTSEKNQNIPIFRLVYTLLENNTVDTKFEMSQDGVKFMTYVQGKSKKLN